MINTSIVGLELCSKCIVLNGFFILCNFIERKGPIIKRLEVFRVILQCLSIIINCLVVASLLSMAETSIVVKVCMIRHQVYCTCKVFNGITVLARPVATDPPVIVGVRVAGVHLQGGAVVRDRLVELLQLVVGEPAVEPGFEVPRVAGQRAPVLQDGALQVAPLAQLVPPRVVPVRRRRRRRRAAKRPTRRPRWPTRLCESKASSSGVRE
mmetsp:Transcript_32615/g.53228  ORF Transcript_32615/g.53228 Transcript_32615/m.53228 type:complete len:210 (-) Transcript_32615:286-915(-)